MSTHDFETEGEGREWEAQERALREERAGAPPRRRSSGDTGIYRLIVRALRNPRLDPLPSDFAAQVAARVEAESGAADFVETWLERGLVVVSEDRIVVPSLAEAVSDLVLQEARTAAASATKLAELSSAVPHLVAATTRPDPTHVTEVHPLDGELSSGGNPLELLQLMMRTSRGDMLWLRPDAWRMPARW